MRSVSSIVGLALLPGLLGCAASSTFEALTPLDQGQFQRCSEPLAEQLCRGRDPEARAACLAVKAGAFARRATSKMRRRWLEENGCPAALIEAAVATAPPGPALAAAPETETAPSPASAVPAPADGVTAKAEGDRCRRSAECSSDLCLRGTCVTTTALEAARLCQDPVLPAAAAHAAPSPPAAPPAVEEALPATEQTAKDKEPAVGPPSARLRVGAAAEEQLREAIVSHDAQMKMCVERQLKLVPTLRAEGKLIIEVDPRGNVSQAGLKGHQLEGTGLERCLRDLAVRWRFPRKAAAYIVEAPLRVSGVDR